MFTIYSKENCTFCKQAKALLESKGISFNERKITTKDDLIYKELVGRLNYEPKTVPQIFLYIKHIGGFTELKKFLETWQTPE